MSFKKSFNSTANNLKNDKTTDLSLSDQLNHFEHKRTGCDSLLEQSKLVDRFFSDSEMNNLSMLIQFFQFLLQSIKNSRQNATKLIIRLPGSDLLLFSYTHLRLSSSTDEAEKTLLEKFVPVLSEVLQILLELHPFCCEQLDSIAIFDRLEAYIHKTSNEDIQLKVTELISQVEKLRNEHDQKTKKT